MVAQTQVMYWGGHYQEGLKKHWSNFDLFYTIGLFYFVATSDIWCQWLCDDY